MTTTPSEKWLSDLNVFAVNRLAAHSDHYYYQTMAEAKKQSPMTMRHSLNGNWKFHYTTDPNSRPKEFYQTDFDCKAWGNITVPGHMQFQGYGSPQYVNTMYPWDGVEDIRPPELPKGENPVGSYVKYFDVPANLKNKPVYISFQGVETAFYVWLNGEFVGYSEDSFTPAEFDLTPYVKDGENKLAVEVYQRSTGSWLEDQDFWRLSGIFRDVYLYTVPEIHVYDLHVRVDLENNYTLGKLDAQLQFHAAVPAGSKVVAELVDKQGNVVATNDQAITQEKLALSFDVDTPKLWSAEDPYLYQLYVQVFNPAGELVEVIPQRVGFRKFELVDKVMKINGERIVFKGVNRHEFSGRTGRTVSKEDMILDVKTMKRNNINAVRTSHYPNSSYWYQLCDEYGLYVIDEMNLETHGSWQKLGAVEPSWNIPGNNMEWNDIVLDRAVSMFERDKNHPSIIIWSCGNESYAGEVILNVTKYFKSVDPSRLVHYEGVFHNRDYNETSDMESRMYAKPADIEEYLDNNPDKPYISCEYMHAMGNSLGGMYKYTDLEKKYDMYQGGFIWDYIDQSIIKKDRYGKEFFAYGGDFGDRPTDYSFSGNGIVFSDRTETPKMQEVKYLYQNMKLEPTEQAVVVRNENLFVDTSAYVLTYALYQEGQELYSNQVDVKVAAQSEQTVELDIPAALTEAAGEYYINVSLNLKENTLWAEAGYEVAFGQHVFKVSADQQTEQAVSSNQLRVVEGDVNIGVHGTDFSVIFSKAVGSLASINYAGKEMIETPPMPMFWRATTDNDKGFEQQFHAGVWYLASIARKCVDIELVKDESSATVTFTYQLPISTEVVVKVAYTVLADGSVKVRSAYMGAEDLPHMPTFGVSFKMSADYDQLTWHAYGPEENYSDRAHGARLGVFSNTVADNVTNYMVPQESGNRTGVRWIKVADQYNQGITIASTEQPVECNVSPYTAFELENANHHFELPARHYTVVTVAGKQMGVGGDDSWGAPVHDEHLIKSNQNMTFEFTIERL